MASTIPAAPESGAIDDKPRARKKQPKPARPARLQFEKLEDRDVLAAVVDVAVAEVSSEVLNASAMSAFFEQSALYAVGQPTSHPTITWTSRDEFREAAAAREWAAEQRAQPSYAQDLELSEERDELGHEQLHPGMGGRAAGGIKKLFRMDGTWPRHVFAPYVDMGADFDLERAAMIDGIMYFNLAFVAADSQNEPSWCGEDECAIDGGKFDTRVREQIAALRALGGDVAVSFGGPQGRELAEAISNVEDLTGAYRQVVETYGLRRVDFDLSAAALDDAASVERRSQAISALQTELAKQGRSLEVWLTLPATRDGLTDGGKQAVESALRHGVEIGGVNLKTSAEEAPADQEAHGQLGVRAIEATINGHYQVRKLLGSHGVSAADWTKIGVTPTIDGNADAAGFQPADARELLEFARRQGIGMIGMWTQNGEGSPAGQTPGNHAGAGHVEHDATEFSDIFQQFNELFAR